MEKLGKMGKLEWSQGFTLLIRSSIVLGQVGSRPLEVMTPGLGIQLKRETISCHLGNHHSASSSHLWAYKLSFSYSFLNLHIHRSFIAVLLSLHT